jgi:hypothetical protein
MRHRADRVRTACRLAVRGSLASLVTPLTFGTLAAVLPVATSPAQAADRYDSALFVCRSIDPTNTPLNLREKPFGRILGTLSRQSLLYVRGRDLRRPLQGYVPVRFYMQSAIDGPRRAAGQFGPSAPAGWVWKTYLTCELVS